MRRRHGVSIGTADGQCSRVKRHASPGTTVPAPSEPAIRARSAALRLDGGSASVREAPAIDDEGSGVGEAGPFPRRQSALAQSRSRRPVAETESNLSDTGPAITSVAFPTGLCTIPTMTYRVPVFSVNYFSRRIASIKALPTTIGEIARVRVQRDMPVHRTEVFKRGMGYRESPGYPGGDDRTGLGLDPGNEKDGVVDADVGKSQSLSAGGADSS